MRVFCGVLKPVCAFYGDDSFKESWEYMADNIAYEILTEAPIWSLQRLGVNFLFSEF